MINVSPIGRNCSRTERDDFEKYDKVRWNTFCFRGGVTFVTVCNRSTACEQKWSQYCQSDSPTWIWSFRSEVWMRRKKNRVSDTSFSGQISFDCFPQGWDKTYDTVNKRSRFQRFFSKTYQVLSSLHRARLRRNSLFRGQDVCGRQRSWDLRRCSNDWTHRFRTRRHHRAGHSNFGRFVVLLSLVSCLDFFRFWDSSLSSRIIKSHTSTRRVQIIPSKPDR